MAVVPTLSCSNAYLFNIQVLTAMVIYMAEYVVCGGFPSQGSKY